MNLTKKQNDASFEDYIVSNDYYLPDKLFNAILLKCVCVIRPNNSVHFLCICKVFSEGFKEQSICSKASSDLPHIKSANIVLRTNVPL